MRPLCLTCVVLLLASAILNPALFGQQDQTADPAFKEQMGRGHQSLQEGKYKEALDAFKKANKLKHDACGECFFLIALTYFRLHDLDRAKESCDRAIATGDNDVRAFSHNLKGNLLLGQGSGDNGKWQQAEDEFAAAVQLDPKVATFHLNLAKALLRESKDDEAKKELQLCLDCASDNQQKSDARKLLVKPELGREDLAPVFELTTMQGQQLSLQGLAGRIVVMDFWATWCPPCRESVPELKDLTKRYPTEKLTLISVSADEDEKTWREFVAKRKMDWAQYRDADHKILDDFGIRSFPTYLVIDGDGVIKQRIIGMNPHETVVHRLKEVLSHMPQLEGEAHR